MVVDLFIKMIDGLKLKKEMYFYLKQKELHCKTNDSLEFMYLFQKDYLKQLNIT